MKRAPTKRVMVLVVSTHPEDYADLCAILPAAQWNVQGVSSWTEAATLYRANPDAVVITEADLADQDWRSILRQLIAGAGPLGPKLIVTSHVADDRLWSEVLNHGGFNVLAKPFDRCEVDWVLRQAATH